MTTTMIPDWDEIAAPGMELGALHRLELQHILTELRVIHGKAARSGATVLHHCGGPDQINDADPGLQSAARDAAHAYKRSEALIKRIERQLAGQA